MQSHLILSVEPRPICVFDEVCGATRSGPATAVRVHDLPFMFHVAVEDIQAGEELLTEFGEHYWEAGAYTLPHFSST